MPDKVIRISEPGEVMFVDGPLTLTIRPADKDAIAEAWERMKRYLHAYNDGAAVQGFYDRREQR